MRLYIAGKMRGIPYFNFPRFDAVAKRLRERGHDPVSPADLDREHGFDPSTMPPTSDWDAIPNGFSLDGAVRRDLEAIIGCDGILMLNGWESSQGANAELCIARWLRKKVLYESTFFNPLIGLTGFARCGKDTAAQALADDWWTRVALADWVREAALAIDPLVHANGHPGGTFFMPYRMSYLRHWHTWETAKDENPDVRRLLQRVGTEAGRNIHGDDCWLKLAKRKIDAADGPVVVTDVRFPNEAAAIREWGGKVVRITRTGVGPVNGHSSEAQDFDADIGIDNIGTIEDLHRAIRQVARRIQADLDERADPDPAPKPAAPDKSGVEKVSEEAPCLGPGLRVPGCGKTGCPTRHDDRPAVQV